MKILKWLTLPVLLLAGYNSNHAQSFEVSITPVIIDGLGGLQSYAVATYDGDWLLVGGRLDGLHQRQPFASFSADGRNQDLIVVNPKTKQVWRAPLSVLPTSIAEQLASTNMQFHQSGEQLLCTGGYAYSSSVGDHITFPYLTIIEVPQTISDVKHNNVNTSTFHQIESETFRVTGGALDKIEDTYYLVGGQSFMGRYNPMGPNHGPGFVQKYTDEIRKFTISDDSQPTVQFLPASHDEMHLHRRDYNLVPYISDGERQLMVYSGVFKSTVDLPWLYPVSISKDGYMPHEDFNQYFNHYHCAYLPIYDADLDEMHTLFFGGIAQFYKENELLVQDNDVPFVNTIATVTRNKYGALEEKTLPTQMPGYMGAGAVFMLDVDTPLADEGILDGSVIGESFEEIGYIYGGIRSSMPNIFWTNTGVESEASATIHKVSLKRIDVATSTSKSHQEQHLEFYPNPAMQLVRMSIVIDTPVDITISITDTMGRLVEKRSFHKEELVEGENILVLDDVNIGYGSFFYTVNLGTKLITRKVIWTE